MKGTCSKAFSNAKKVTLIKLHHSLGNQQRYLAMLHCHLVLGRALEENGDIKGALGAYADALRAEPDNKDAQELFQSLSYAPNLSTPLGRP